MKDIMLITTSKNVLGTVSLDIPFTSKSHNNPKKKHTTLRTELVLKSVSRSTFFSDQMETGGYLLCTQRQKS